MKKVILLTLIFHIWFLAAAENKTLDDLVNEAIEKNYQKEVFEANIKSLDSAISAAPMFMDPMIGVEYSSMPVSSPWPGENMMSGLQLKIQQTFPFPGKNDARSDLFKKMKDIKTLQYAEWKDQITFKIKSAYYKLHMVRKLKEVSKQHIKALGKFISTIKAGYEGGKASQFFLIRLSVVKNKLIDEIDEYDKNIAVLKSAINSVLSRDLNHEIQTEFEHTHLKSLKTVDEYLEIARLQRDKLKILTNLTELEQRKIKVVEAERNPDITAWAGYRFRKETGMDPGDDFISIGVSIPLPFDYTGKDESKKSLHSFNKISYNAEKKKLLEEIKFQITESILEWKRAVKKVRVYKNKLIPGLRESLDSALFLYQTGKVTFESLYQTELQILNFERMAIMSEVTPLIMNAKIDMIVGGENE